MTNKIINGIFLTIAFVGMFLFGWLLRADKERRKKHD